MADDLTDEERELIAKHREKAKADKDKQDGELRVQVFGPDGSGAELPYAKAKKWLAKMGFDLDDEPVQDEPSDDDKDDDKPSGVTRFGRRVS